MLLSHQQLLQEMVFQRLLVGYQVVEDGSEDAFDEPFTSSGLTRQMSEPLNPSIKTPSKTKKGAMTP